MEENNDSESGEGGQCEVCNKAMTVFDEETTLTSQDTALNANGTMWLSWKQEDCKDLTFHVCEECEILVVIHNKCENAMLFEGHMGFDSDGLQHMRNGKTKTKVELGVDAKCVDLTKPRFDISDCGKYKFRTAEWMPTGPDGTYKQFWYCEECKESYSFCEN